MSQFRNRWCSTTVEEDVAWFSRQLSSMAFSDTSRVDSMLLAFPIKHRLVENYYICLKKAESRISEDQVASWIDCLLTYCSSTRNYFYRIGLESNFAASFSFTAFHLLFFATSGELVALQPLPLESFIYHINLSQLAIPDPSIGLHTA